VEGVEAGKERGEGEVTKTLATIGQIKGSSPLVISDDNSPNLLSDHNFNCIAEHCQ